MEGVIASEWNCFEVCAAGDLQAAFIFCAKPAPLETAVLVNVDELLMSELVVFVGWLTELFVKTTSVVVLAAELCEMKSAIVATAEDVADVVTGGVEFPEDISVSIVNTEMYEDLLVFPSFSLTSSLDVDVQTPFTAVKLGENGTVSSPTGSLCSF